MLLTCLGCPDLQDMMKGMDPEQLSEMMKASGANLTPEQARSLVNKLDSVSGEACRKQGLDAQACVLH